jgi:protein-tyrosine phosphatase
MFRQEVAKGRRLTIASTGAAIMEFAGFRQWVHRRPVTRGVRRAWRKSMYKLLNSSEMPEIPNIKVPHDFYWVLNDPAPLAGMRRPLPTTPWSDIAGAGFCYVVCLLEDTPKYNQSPLKLLHTAKLENLSQGGPPKNPQREEDLIRQCVRVTLSMISTGEGVVLHCWGGRGRTGTVIGCVLRELGFSSSEILIYLDQLHKDRGKPGWPESDWQARFVERFK